jgi:hypothetical protein
MNVQVPRDLWIIGNKLGDLFGSTIVLDDRNPTEFSITAKPGMFVIVDLAFQDFELVG